MERFGVEGEITHPPLHHGDFLIWDKNGISLAIERKRVDDFAASIGDGRLRAQIPALRNEFDRAVVALEGSWKGHLGEKLVLNGRPSGFSPASFLGAMYSVGRQVALVPVPDLQGTFDLLEILAKRGKKKGF